MPALSVVRFALSAWYAFNLLERASEPKPRDSPEIRSGDPGADRILLIGNGPCHGWGVLTHQLAVPGQLARAMRARTGRACDVDYVGAESMNARAAGAWLGDRDLEPYDAVVIAVGVNDALRRTPPVDWRNALIDLVAAITPRLRPDTTVHLAGMPPIRSIAGYDTLVGRFAEPHRRRLQDVVRELAVDLGLPPLIELGDPGVPTEDGSAVYAAHAASLADRLAPALLARTPVARPALPEPEPWTWPGAPTVLDPQETGGLPALRALADRAEARFKVEFAVVTILNGDRLWHAMNTEVFPPSVPSKLSYCTYTIEEGGPLVVGNTALDPRFADNPLKQLSFINFYAGVPIEDSTGTIIGTFCLHGSRPKSAARFPIAELQAMALEAQEELRRHEAIVAE